LAGANHRPFAFAALCRSRWSIQWSLAKGLPHAPRRDTDVAAANDCLIALLRNRISLFRENCSEGSAMISALKVQTLETDLIEKIKAAIKKRAEAKAKRMFLKRPKRLTKR
jgi:hypothetical protein